ncbi:MAG: ABC transporter permease [Candidatus Methanoplasma sp.]|jgi:NitT/TauT family transport system permease protein|nr:ABC transporter permease [Candidatus Methanoplasma sp.]
MAENVDVEKKSALGSGPRVLAKYGIKFIHIFGAIILFIIAWEAACQFNLVNNIIVISPSRILEKGWELTLDGTLFKHMSISLKRVILSFGSAVVVGLALGFVLGGFFKRVETAINPLLQLISQANPFTLLPLFIVLLGLGELSKFTVMFLVCIWPVLFNTVTGIKNADPVLVKMGRSLGLSKFQIFYKILIRDALPTIFTGIRMSVVFAFFMLIGAEMLGASSGLGYMIHHAQAVFLMPEMWVGIVTVALLGVIANLIISFIERKVTGRKEEIVV